jgi:hypothetical protein
MMLMPETPMHKDDCLETREYEVWAARQSAIVKSKSKSRSVQKTPNDDFRLGILPTDTGHHPTACFAIDDVCHLSRGCSQWQR